MAKTTDELFAEATEADYETIAPMVLAASDTEEEFQFRIDEHLRTIAIPEKGVVAGVEGDLNVNIARFTMVRYYHGRDLSKLSIRINYRNANGQVNYYTVSDATVSGDSIVFSWEYAADVTQYKGNVQFVVYLFSATNATLKQRFFSTLGTLEVLEGLEVDSSIPASEQTDILLHLKKDLSAYAEEVKKSLPADYTAMTEQVNSLKEDKVDYVQNLAALPRLKKSQAFNATVTENDDGSITVVPKAYYGRYDFEYSVPDEGKEKTFYFSAKLTSKNTSQVISSSMYCFNGGNNLNELKKLATRTALNGTVHNISQICKYKDTQYKTNKIVIGLMTNTGIEYTITKKSMLLIDITELAESATNPNKLLDKCEILYGTDYWEKIVEAETAKTAETAETAKTASFETYTVNAGNVSGFASTVDSVDGNTITVTSSTTYGAIGIPFKMKENHRYLLVWSGDSFNEIKQLAGNSWNKSDTIKTITLNGTKYYYGTLIPINKGSVPVYDFIYLDTINKTTKTITVVTVQEVGVDETINDTYIKERIENKTYKIADSLEELYEMCGKKKQSLNNSWYGKNVLVIGDSITAAQKWQKKLNTLLEMNVTTHAKGGVGTVAMVDGDKGLGGDYDNETSAGGVLKPLSVDDVKDKDLIVVLPAYNDRGKDDGAVGDCYNPDGSGQNTIAGIVQYTINRIYETLKEADNLNCKVLYATPHCAGKYPYIDADGYTEYPAGSGRTMETLANTIVAIGNHNNIPVCDLWHNSGINKFTWNVYGNSPNPVNTQYSPYKLDSSGNPTSTTRIRYVKGQSYYQVRDGAVVLEKYTGSAPFPYNADQLHCSSMGYARLGECIVGAIISQYGN